MKITKTQLKRLIKEELTKIMEGSGAGPQEIRRGHRPDRHIRSKNWDEETDIPLIQKAITDMGMEVSDPGMANWNPSQDQIVYQGAAPNRSGGKDIYFKTSNSNRHYMISGQ